MKVPVVILTVPRKRNYVNGTLDSLLSSGYLTSPSLLPVRVVTGSPQSDHIDSIWRKNPQIQICEMPHEVALEAHLDSLSTQQKCCFGHYWWMRLLVESGNLPEYVLACEDDIVFARGWEHYLSEVLRDVKAHDTIPAIITLYRLYLEGHTQDHSREQFERGARWYEISSSFWGTQAVLYPTAILKSLAEFLFENNVQTFMDPVDILIGRFAWSRGIHTIATSPSLVNHVGEETTGQSKYFHRAEYFLESVEEFL